MRSLSEVRNRAGSAVTGREVFSGLCRWRLMGSTIERHGLRIAWSEAGRSAPASMGSSKAGSSF